MLLDLTLYPSNANAGGLRFRLGYGNRANPISTGSLDTDIIVTEDAFSLIEDILLQGQPAAAHWGVVHIDQDHLERAILSLKNRQHDLTLTHVSVDSLMRFMFHKEKRRLASLRKTYRLPAVRFIAEIIVWINANPNVNGITTFGI